MKHRNPTSASPVHSGSSVARLLVLALLELSVLRLTATTDAAAPSVVTLSDPDSGMMHMTAVTELTNYGKTLPAASPEHPVYYVLHDCGQRSKSEGLADEKCSPPAELPQLLRRSLAANGFLAADSKKHEAALALYYHYGTHRKLDAESAALFPDKDYAQQTERAYLIGGKAFGHRFERWGRRDVLFGFSPQKQAFLMEQLSNDIHYVIVSAYMSDKVTKNAPRLLWRTTLTVNGRGSSPEATLGPLVLSAGPFFGHETSGAVAMQRQVKPGSAEFGPLRIIDDPMLASSSAKAGTN